VATLIPSHPPQALTMGVAKVRRALKSLPDESYIVWQHLALRDDRTPEFLVLSKHQRCALIKVSSATPRDAQRVLQPELLSSAQDSPAFGDLEQTTIDHLLEKIGQPWRKDTTPGIVIFPGLVGANLSEAIQGSEAERSIWLSGSDLNPSTFEGAIADALGSRLGPEELGRLRLAFTPEVEIPAEFTVRAPVERSTAPELTGYLMDYRQEWLVKSDLDLNREASEAAREFNVRLVNGVAGSGKSLILVYRAKLVRDLFPQKRILVLTHNKPLIQDLEQRYETLSEGDDKVEWRTFLSWCYSILPPSVDLDQPLGEERRSELIASAHRKYLADTSITADLLEAEVDWFKDHLMTKRSEYLQADRSGRGFALQESMRNRVFDAMQDYDDQLDRLGCIDWGDVPRRVWGLVQDAKLSLPKYDAILVDEAQFFAPIWFELIKLAIQPKTGHLFIVADPTQGFLRRGQSWLASGLEVRGRTVRLNKSYRTTRQILDFATLLYRSRLLEDDEDIVVPDLLDMPIGAVPVVLPMTSPQDELQRVTAEIVQLIKAGVPGRDVLAIHATWQGVDGLMSRLSNELGEGQVIDPKQSAGRDQVRVCTLNAATGLESPIVFLAGLRELQEKELSLRISDDDRAELIRDNTRKIYMAITRAGQRIVVTYCGELPLWLRAGTEAHAEEMDSALA